MLNLSAGADRFKLLRRGIPVEEFDAVYERHLPASQRRAWDILEITMAIRGGMVDHVRNFNRQWTIVPCGVQSGVHYPFWIRSIGRRSDQPLSSPDILRSLSGTIRANAYMVLTITGELRKRMGT